MKFILSILFFVSFSASSQLVARILHRAGSGEAINMYEQLPPANPNGRLCAATIWLHGAGERGTPGDTTTSNGLPKLKNPGTSPAALLATMMVPHYKIPNQTDTLYTAWFEPQCNIAYSVWPPWYDSAVLAYIKTTYPNRVDTNRIALMGHSQGGGGCWASIADSSNSTQHNFISPCSSGYFPSTLTGTGYAQACRTMPHIRNFHAADDGTAAVTLSDGMVNGVNAASYNGFKGPLCTINYIRFSGATPGSSGHNITFLVFAFAPTGTNYAESNGDNWLFNMTVHQEALQFSNSPKRRPPNF